MKVKSIKKELGRKLEGGSLPDIDNDFLTRDRDKIKSYIENRFGEKQVCSVGAYTTMKIKSTVKDLARICSVDYSEANIVTSMMYLPELGDQSFLQLLQIAVKEPKIKQFIKTNSEIFYLLPILLNQPKTKSIHPCAVITFPSAMESKEWAPMRYQQGQIVSEWTGGELDSGGFLKNDVLGINQLDKLTDICNLIEKNGKEVPDIFDLPEDSEVYRYYCNGWNSDVFQMKSSGLSEYCKAMKPQELNDLVAAVALYRPGPMGSGYHTSYVKCKNEGAAPKYLWGTEEMTKDTFGLLIYQEQIMEICKRVGGLDSLEADSVRKAMGKKKLSELLPWKARVMTGFIEKGSTESEFLEFWDAAVEFASYAFNKSHSVAYAMTGYICQYLKVHYPIEFWTIALTSCSEEETSVYLSEILQSGQIQVKGLNINKSSMGMSSSQENSTIYWGLGSIKGVGEDTAMQIINEREKNGAYKSFADFYYRHTYTGSKVKKQIYEALIASGSFDELYGFEGSEERRYLLINRYRKFKKVKIPKPERDVYSIGEISKNWWWKKQQKILTGLSIIDYKDVVKDYDIDSDFLTLHEFNMRQDYEIFRSFGGYVTECKISKGVKGKFARLTVEHNYKLFRIMIWTEEYNKFAKLLEGCEKSLILFNAGIRYDSKYSKANQFTLKKNSQLIIL